MWDALVHEAPGPERESTARLDRRVPHALNRRARQVLIDCDNRVVRDDGECFVRHIRHVVSEDERTLKKGPHREVRYWVRSV